MDLVGEPAEFRLNIQRARFYREHQRDASSSDDVVA